MKKPILSIPLALSLLLLLIGYVSRVQHWPFGVEMERTGFVLIALFYAIRYLRKNTVRYKDTLKFVLVISWCGLSLLASFKLQHISFLIYSIMAIGFFWLILEMKDIFKHGFKRSNMILVVGALLLALEALFRIQHWPLSSIIHLISLLILVLGFFTDNVFRSKRKSLSD